MEAPAKMVLLDIEGTTSSVSFVYDVLFPFARKNMPQFLERRFNDEKVTAACNQLAIDLGFKNGLTEWQNQDQSKVIEKIILEANKLMDADVKATGLKELQGLIWAEGYEKGVLKSHVYEDVEPALKAWKSANLEIRIFSSGSIGAQKVFFKNTEYGDFSAYLSDHYDTTTGPKKEANSYRLISQDANIPAPEVVFLSDVVEELDAAYEANMRTVLVKRPGNKPIKSDHNHDEITTFDELHVVVNA